MRDGRRADEVQALQVDVDDPVPFVLGGLRARALRPHPGGVDDGIEAARPLRRFGDRPPAFVDVAQVGDDRQHVGRLVLDGSSGLMSTAATLQPPATKRVDRCAADAAGGTGDQCDGRHERSSGNELPPSTTIC